jgi:hypothetical protein
MPARCNYLNDVLFLGYSHIKTKYDIYAALMPFINEILNLVTLTITKPYYNFEIYPHHPKTMFQDLLKTSIDMLAVTGIVANAAKYGKLYSINMGFVKGSLYALFTFLIPNLFMLNILDISKTPIIRFIIGIIFIYLLDLSVNYLSCMYLDYMNREKVSN